jgi:hypothetical protein
MKRACVQLSALALYSVLVVWLTWPLAARMGTDLPDTVSPCRYDTTYMTWVLSQETHALMNSPSQFLNANIYFPARQALLYGDTGLSALLYFFPIFALGQNPTLAINLVFFICVVLTAWSLHLVVDRWTGSYLAGFAAAWTFLTTPWVLWTFVPSAPSYAVLQYFPWIVLLASRADFGWRHVALLVPLLILQSLADAVYVATAVIVPVGTLAIVRLSRATTRRSGSLLALSLLLTLLAIMPVYLGSLLVLIRNVDLLHQTHWTAHRCGSLKVIDFIMHGPAAVGIPALALVAIGFGLRTADRTTPRGPASAAWYASGFWALVGVVISLPPAFEWNGGLVPLFPQSLIERWTGAYEVIRVPRRLGIPGLMGMAILVGLSCSQIREVVGNMSYGTRRSGVFLRRGLLLVIVLIWSAAMYFQLGARVLLPYTYPIAPAPALSPTILKAFAQGRGPILELPVPSVSDSPELQAKAMYHSIAHWRPLLNGYSSYWPAGFPERMSVARNLPDETAIARLRSESGLETILVHLARLDRIKRTAWREVAFREDRPDLKLIAQDGDDFVFAVTAN